MSSRRTQKAAQAIREVVSMAILADLNDPRVQDVTVTYVEVAPDMRQAKVHVSVRGSETKQRLSLQGLRSAAGYLQAKLASRIETRYTPRLEFVLDLGVKKSIEMSQILGAGSASQVSRTTSPRRRRRRFDDRRRRRRRSDLNDDDRIDEDSDDE